MDKNKDLIAKFIPITDHKMKPPTYFKKNNFIAPF